MIGGGESIAHPFIHFLLTLLLRLRLLRVPDPKVSPPVYHRDTQKNKTKENIHAQTHSYGQFAQFAL